MSFSKRNGQFDHQSERCGNLKCLRNIEPLTLESIHFDNYLDHVTRSIRSFRAKTRPILRQCVGEFAFSQELLSFSFSVLYFEVSRQDDCPHRFRSPAEGRATFLSLIDPLVRDEVLSRRTKRARGRKKSSTSGRKSVFVTETKSINKMREKDYTGERDSNETTPDSRDRSCRSWARCNER